MFGATNSPIGPLTREYEANNGPTEPLIIEDKFTADFQDRVVAY